MAMNEIFVVDEDTDDLEEGEITDDVEVLILPEEKPKQLPRRYTLYNKGPIARYKNYKHKERNKFQNPSKLESFHRKKHKSSCPRHSSEKHRLKHRGAHNNHNSFVTKSAFKNYTSPPRAPPRKVNSNLQNSEKEINFPEMLLDYKKAREKVLNIQDNSCMQNEVVSIANSIKASNSSVQQELPDALPMENLTEIKNAEESDEDVEELRRKALATCAKKQLVSKANEESSNEMPKLSSNNLPSLSNSDPLNQLIETFHAECDNDSRDNYEVVDMELEEEEGSCQIVHNDNLFIIDKTPANTEFSPSLINGQLNQSIQRHSNVENGNHMHSNHSQPIDDFEEQLLRAEVIASMNSTRQKRQSPPKFPTPVEEKVLEIITKVDMIHNAVNTLHNGMKPKSCTIYSKGPLQNSVKQPLKRIIDTKSKFSNFKNNKTTASPPPPRGVNTIQERLIITLNNDTSSDESEEETNENTASQDVPVSSIEALISSARQKSDAAHFSNGSSANVSCLSKAQQEEYNSLKKLLAEKTQYSVPTSIVKGKDPPNQSHKILLCKKISVAKANLGKEAGIKNQIEKELLEKKKNYMASKLRVQMLKEKLHAAEKIRAANLESWKQCSAKLDIVRKSVSKRESLLKLLETELNTKNACFEPNSTISPL